MRSVPLPAAAAPAEIRLAGERYVLISREPYRVAPAGASRIIVLDAGGRTTFNRAIGLDIPLAQTVTVLDATVTRSGDVVVSAFAAGGIATRHLLVIYEGGDPGVVRLVDSAPVACRRLAHAPDDSIWCMGPHVAFHNSGRTDFNFLHQFTRQGVLIRSVAPRAHFPAAPRPWDGRDPDLIVGSDRIVVWMPELRSLVTYAMDGREIRRTEVARRVSLDPAGDRTALTSDGRLLDTIVETPRPAAKRSWATFDEQHGRWQPLDFGRTPYDLWPLGGRAGELIVWDRGASRVLIR